MINSILYTPKGLRIIMVEERGKGVTLVFRS